jgi:hypothetical protein
MPSQANRVLHFFRENPGTILDLVRSSKREDFPSEEAYVGFQQRAHVRARSLCKSGLLMRELRPSVDATGKVQDQWHYWEPDEPMAPVTETRRDVEILKLEETIDRLIAERDSLLELLDAATAPAKAA